MKRTWTTFPSSTNPYQQRCDIMGKTFSRLTVVKFVGRDRRKALIWECRCQCGNTKIGLGKDLRSGHLTNCGCQTNILKGNATRTHGMRHTPEYSTWVSMRDRCLNPNNLSYYRYGGRGILVHKPWADSFESFFADMGKRPLDTSLERKNNDGNYEPSNCIWATRHDQINNRSISIGINLKEIARKRGIGYKYAWSLYRAGRL